MAQPDHTRNTVSNSQLDERSPLFQKNQVQLHRNEPYRHRISNHQAVHLQETSFGDSIQPQSNQLRRNHCRASCRRLPKGKGAFLVFLIYFLESFAFYSTLGGLQQILFGNQPGSVWIFTLLDGTAGRIVYPIAGVIADTYLGRYKVIHIGLWLLWIAFAILGLSQALTVTPLCNWILPIISAVLISVGSGSVEVNAISFGVDQLAQGATSDELSSYFYWYYFARNTGNLAAVILSLCVHALFGVDSSLQYSNVCGLFVVSSAISVVAVVAITIALILHYCLQDWYYKGRQQENPLRSIINVLYYSATVKRGLPVYRRTYRYGEERKPRIELAKIEFDGIFPSDEVEDVKTFCRILFLLVTLIGYFVTFGAAYSMLGYEMDNASSELGIYNYLTAEILTFINVMTYIILLPILNHVLIPLFCRCNMRVRIGCGLAFIILSHIVSIYLRTVASSLSTMDYLGWLVLPAILINIGDAVTIVSAVEFIYAQSPESMKGLLTGLLYLEYGVFNGLAAVLFSVYPRSTSIRFLNSILGYYVILTVLALLGFVGFVIVAYHYRNRQRPTSDCSEEELERRRLAERRYLLS